jgi:ParB/Sulfiredoxin domain
MSKNEATNVLSREFRCEWRSVHALKPNPHNPRVHPKQQIRELAKAIQALGFTCPILIDEHGVVLAGHARLEAAKLVGLDPVPVIVIEGLSPAKKEPSFLLTIALPKKPDGIGQYFRSSYRTCSKFWSLKGSISR